MAGGGVLIVESMREAGKKILMSGGSRCNVLPAAVDIDRDYFAAQTLLASSSKATRRKAAVSRKALHRHDGCAYDRIKMMLTLTDLLNRIFATWSIEGCRRWLEHEVGLELAMEEATSKWFPRSNSAREVRDRLVELALAKGADIVYNKRVLALQRGLWRCSSEDGEEFQACSVILAMGGKSFPAVGTDGKGYKLAETLGHTLQPIYPALTPLTGPHPGGQQLAGVSLNVGVAASREGESAFAASAHRTGFVFSHRGYSGPAILDLSHHAVIDLEKLCEAPAAKPTSVNINWCEDMSAEAWREIFLSSLGKGGKGATRLASNMVSDRLPHRLAVAICQEAGVADLRVADLSREQREHLIGLLTSYTLPYTGHQGFKKAEVTGGGVDLAEIKWESLESALEANCGLFFCGEVLDCFGRIGGFNFYWAWLTGRLAGVSIPVS